jgi:uncharacterized membrane protein
MKKNIIDSIGSKLTYWNGGFYSNKNDSRIMVPKENPEMGWRLNFGNPKAIILLILTITVMIGVFVFLGLMFGVQSH